MTTISTGKRLELIMLAKLGMEWWQTNSTSKFYSQIIEHTSHASVRGTVRQNYGNKLRLMSNKNLIAISLHSLLTGSSTSTSLSLPMLMCLDTWNVFTSYVTLWLHGSQYFLQCSLHSFPIPTVDLAQARYPDRHHLSSTNQYCTEHIVFR